MPLTVAVLTGVGGGDNRDVGANGGVNPILPAAAVDDIVNIDNQAGGRGAVLAGVLLHLHGPGHNHAAALDQNLGHLLGQSAVQVQVGELVLLQAVLALLAILLALFVGAVGQSHHAGSGAAQADAEGQERLLFTGGLLKVGGGGSDVALQLDGVGNALGSHADAGSQEGTSVVSVVVSHDRNLLYVLNFSPEL